MRLLFLNREEELLRLRNLLATTEGSLGVLYGRRRCGKSRLMEEALPRSLSVYYVGDDRESALQRANLAVEIGRLIPGFEEVLYPDWDVLLRRWWDEAHAGSILALDEFPALVSAAREVPSLLQKNLDSQKGKGVHVILGGSSQRMMQGLVLDQSAPLFGRAREILKVAPLPAGLIPKALRLRGAVESVEAYAMWGGIPRYWELAAEYQSLMAAIRALVLSPLGVLHDEPRALLLDDMRDTTQASSILSLIGRGCHRVSEIAGRLEKAATALYRPLQRLVEMDLVTRLVPYGTTARDTKRTLYRIGDPFCRFWFRFVEPNRSRLEARQIDSVASEIERSLAHHVGSVWEELARTSVSRMELFDRTWKPAGRWWGAGLDRKPMEVDVVAESEDGAAILLGEAKWKTSADAGALLSELRHKAQRLPLINNREVFYALWLRSPRTRARGAEVVSPAAVLRCLR